MWACGMQVVGVRLVSVVCMGNVLEGGWLVHGMAGSVWGLERLVGVGSLCQVDGHVRG